jgi:phospholipid N-methyltransferase
MGTKAERDRDGQATVVASPLSRNGHSTKYPGWFSQFLLFALNFVKHPNMVGWMLPSSPFVVDDVLKQVDWENAKVLVEYGPGVGTFTTKILERMRPDATLIAFEINPDFIKYLKSSVHDPRLHLVEESAAEVDKVLTRLGFSHADYVISGIPFKTLPPALRDVIVQKTHSVLRSEGQFLVYQLSSAALPHLQQVFRRVSRDSQWLSLIPAQMFYCARDPH